MYKFWNFITDETDGRVLRLEGPIDDETFWGDEVTPDAFREELEAEEGDVTVWINSPGGNVFAAAEIYSMLREHNGKITVKIGSLAASAASVIAMAGDKVLMSPVAMLMIHDPQTIAMGSEEDLTRAIESLRGVKESIINAYEAKTGLARDEIARLMSNESWIDAKEAVEKGFADKVLYVKGSRSKGKEPDGIEEEIKDSLKEEYRKYHESLSGKVLLSRIPRADEALGGEENGFYEDSGSPEDVEQPEEGVEEVSKSVTDEEPAVLQPDADAEPVSEHPVGVEGDSSKNTAETTESEEDLGENEPDLAEDEAPVTVQSDTDEETDGEHPEPEKDEHPKPSKDAGPIIGMDGKTEDGAMPYELLKNQLAFLK